jgi:hypothetical protein
MSNTNIKTLLDVQIATKAQVEGIYDENDMIKLSLSVMTIHLAKLIPIFTMASITKVKISDVELIIDDLAMVLEYLFILCNSCNYDIPNDEYLTRFEETIPLEIKHDSILNLQSMMRAISELSYMIFVEMDGEAWDQENAHSDFDQEVSTLIVGMKNLGIRHGFKMKDIYLKVS